MKSSEMVAPKMAKLSSEQQPEKDADGGEPAAKQTSKAASSSKEAASASSAAATLSAAEVGRFLFLFVLGVASLLSFMPTGWKG